MALPHEFVRELQQSAPAVAWSAILRYVWDVCAVAIGAERAQAEVASRDRAAGDLDLYLATAGWDLWQSFEAVVPRTADALASWWAAHEPGRAVLILDGLSLREVPWLLSQSVRRGYRIVEQRATGAELPADTVPFAKAMGFSQRSSLGNNGAPATHRLVGAQTETADIAWRDAANLVGTQPDWVFWHHWPDARLHEHDDPGRGLSTLTREAEMQLTGDDFWAFVQRLATGRRLVITSDHGYAASGVFPDTADKDQTEYLKKTFQSGRWAASGEGPSPWVPPIDLPLSTRHGLHRFVVGRRKWKSPGGYPTLTHGGLSVFEVAVPYIELAFVGSTGPGTTDSGQYPPA